MERNLPFENGLPFVSDGVKLSQLKLPVRGSRGPDKAHVGADAIELNELRPLLAAKGIRTASLISSGRPCCDTRGALIRTRIRPNVSAGRAGANLRRQPGRNSGSRPPLLPMLEQA